MVQVTVGVLNMVRCYSPAAEVVVSLLSTHHLVDKAFQNIMAHARTHQNEDVGGVPHLLVEDDDDDDEQVADEADEADDGEDDRHDPGHDGFEEVLGASLAMSGQEI